MTQKLLSFVIESENVNATTKQSTNQLKRYLWRKIDGGWEPEPLAILCYSVEIAKKIEQMDSESKWNFILERLYDKHTKQFSDVLFDYVCIFWYNNILEDYNEAHERIVKHQINILRDTYNNEKALWKKAKYIVNQELEILPVFII